MATHGVVAVSTELVSDLITPVAAFLRLTQGSGTRVLLESTDNSKRFGRFSILVIDTRETVVIDGGADAFAQLDRLNTSVGSVWRGDSLAELPFVAGVVFALGFECFGELESVGASPQSDLIASPQEVLCTPTNVVVFDHWHQRVTLIHNIFRDDVIGDNAEAFDRAYQDGLDALDSMIALGATPTEEPVLVVDQIAVAQTDPFTEWKAAWTAHDYADAVERMRDHIAAGDIFQAVPSTAFVAPFSPDMLMVYRALRHLNPSPYLYFFETPVLKLAGASPEALVRIAGDNVLTRPIAGTRGRGVTDAEDAELAADLLADAKEIAEHVMLVDLARNDLGRIAEFGTVRVSQFQQVELFSHVMHICSTVEATKRRDVSAVDVLRSVFPAGTLSGAPKIRAVQLINEIEATPRGLYGGVVGYLDASGNLDAAICIRTLMQNKDGVTWTQAGGGIVNDSVPTVEADEVRRKAGAVVAAALIAQGFADNRG